MTAPLTPETALAMAIWVKHLVEHRSSRAPNRQEWDAMHAEAKEIWMWQAEMLTTALASLGFDVRAKEEPEETELESPPFKSDAQAALEARGFVRVNRRKGGGT